MMKRSQSAGPTRWRRKIKKRSDSFISDSICSRSYQVGSSKTQEKDEYFLRGLVKDHSFPQFFVHLPLLKPLLAEWWGWQNMAGTKSWTSVKKVSCLGTWTTAMDHCKECILPMSIRDLKIPAINRLLAKVATVDENKACVISPLLISACFAVAPLIAL